MGKILTVRKQAWVDRRKPEVLRGNALNPSAANEMRYYQKLANLIERMHTLATSDIHALFSTEHAEEFFGTDASVSSQARIVTNALQKKIDAMFSLHAKPMAEAMANAADKASSSSLHESLKQLSGGLSLKTTSLSGPILDVWQASVTENVGLIKSIASQYLTQVQGAVMRSITTGNGLQDLVPFLAQQKDITLRRARMVASDQTRKTMTVLNKARMQKVGLVSYEWLHTAGSNHPRKLHQDYNGRIFRFDDPPVIDDRSGERGIPGQAINCRCRMVPVIDFGDEE